MAEVNKEQIQKWVDALRSGKYQQGRGALRYRRKDGSYEYCCLGVACDISEVGHWRNLGYGDTQYVCSKVGNFWGEHKEVSCLPKPVFTYFGFENSNPIVSAEMGITSITANDREKWTFDQIADALENTYLDEDEEEDDPWEFELLEEGRLGWTDPSVEEDS